MASVESPPESPGRIEPCHLEEMPAAVADLVAEVAAAAAGLGVRLHPRTAASLADLVRVMNTYYSNLIEGHNTRPRDIERALADDLDVDRERRNLQLEARAHIRVQREIDRRFAAGVLGEPTAPDFLRWLHAEFYRDAPPELLRVEGAGRAVTMIPGEFRTPAQGAFAVGRHQPPAAAFLPAFMDHFATRFRPATLGKAQRIVAIATAHHRLNYIHPFPDGNGRVSRLMAHALALEAGIGAHGLWSISRGLARGLADRGEYKSMMDLADTPRQGDADGRGNLSQRALVEFATWFLRVMVDQIRFMAEQFDLGNLEARLRGYVASRPGLRPEAVGLLVDVLARGELPRGEAARATGLGERLARDVVGGLVKGGILASDTAKGPVSLRFPTAAAESLFPRLFPG